MTFHLPPPPIWSQKSCLYIKHTPLYIFVCKLFCVLLLKICRNTLSWNFATPPPPSEHQKIQDFMTYLYTICFKTSQMTIFANCDEKLRPILGPSISRTKCDRQTIFFYRKEWVYKTLKVQYLHVCIKHEFWNTCMKIYMCLTPTQRKFLIHPQPPPLEWIL